MAVGKSLQGFRRHADDEHGATTRRSRGATSRRHHARSGDQGPAQHRPDRADPLARFGAKSLRVSVRREASHRPRHGLFRFRAARAHRQFRGARRPRLPTPPRRTTSSPRRSSAFPSTTSAKICATSTNTWTANAPVRRARYGIALDASLITGIDPPPEVESALAAINTAYNQVSSDISLAQAARGPENRAIQTRGGNRNAQGAGRSAAARRRWPSS